MPIFRKIRRTLAIFFDRKTTFSKSSESFSNLLRWYASCHARHLVSVHPSSHRYPKFAVSPEENQRRYNASGAQRYEANIKSNTSDQSGVIRVSQRHVNIRNVKKDEGVEGIQRR